MRIFALYLFPQLYLSQVFQNIKIFNVIINLPETPPPNNTSLIVNTTDLYIYIYIYSEKKHQEYAQVHFVYRYMLNNSEFIVTKYK